MEKLVGHRKSDLRSEECVYRNLIKSAHSKGLTIEENAELLADLRERVRQNMDLEEDWLKNAFGDDILNDEALKNELLLLFRCLLASLVSDLQQPLRRAWVGNDGLIFSTDDSDCLRRMLKDYLKVDEAEIKTSKVIPSSSLVEDLYGFITDETSLVYFLRRYNDKGICRTLWFRANPRAKKRDQGSKKSQLQPIQVKALRLLACILMSYPSIRTPASNDKKTKDQTVLEILERRFDVSTKVVISKLSGTKMTQPAMKIPLPVADASQSAKKTEVNRRKKPIVSAVSAFVSSGLKSIKKLSRRPREPLSQEKEDEDDQVSLGSPADFFLAYDFSPVYKSPPGPNDQSQTEIGSSFNDSTNIPSGSAHRDAIHGPLPPQPMHNFDSYDDNDDDSDNDDDHGNGDNNESDEDNQPEVPIARRLFLDFADDESGTDEDVPAEDAGPPPPITDEELEKFEKSLVGMVCELAVEGSNATKQIMNALLKGSGTSKQVDAVLARHDYNQKRSKKVIDNKKKRNQVKEKSAERRNITLDAVAPLEELVCQKSFYHPFENNWRKTRDSGKLLPRLLSGLDPEKQERATSVSFGVAACFAMFVAKFCQYRPGKFRCSKLQGVRIVNAPMYIRFGGMKELFQQYKRMLGDKCMGQDLFSKCMHAFTKKGEMQSGLSYFWTNFLLLIEIALKACNRMKELAINDDDTGIWADRAKKALRYSQLYARHEYYARCKKESENGYICMKHALGAECSHGPDHSFQESDAEAIVFSTHVVFRKAVWTAYQSVIDQRGLGKISEEDEMAALDELGTMIDLCGILQKEILHFVKHTLRGCWQETAEKKIQDYMRGKPWVKLVKIDHKNKTLPKKMFEAMSDFFGKHGMSSLGAFVSWWGEKGEKEGWFQWFIDCIMENTTSQEAADVMPGIEAIVDAMLDDSFVEIAGKTTEIILSTDNALTSMELSFFIWLFNEKARAADRQIRIKMWYTNEAQRFKNAVDTHFHYENVQFCRAIMNGGLSLQCPRTMYDCQIYDGGMKANTVMLLKKLNEAQELFADCKQAISPREKQGITSVHSHVYDENGLTMTHFSNLDIGKKTFTKAKLKAISEKYEGNVIPAVGEVLKKHSADKDTAIFIARKADGTDAEASKPDPKTLAGRILPALEKYSGGFIDDFFSERGEAEITEQIQKVDDVQKELTEIISNLFQERDSKVIEHSDTWPPRLPHNWAEKKQRGYLALSDKVKEKLDEWYKQGEGHNNKHLRMNAEQASSMLSTGILSTIWDQQYIASQSRVKSYFGQKHQKEQRQQKRQTVTPPSESYQELFQNAYSIIGANHDAEDSLFKTMKCHPIDENERQSKIEEATAKEFSKLKVPELRAFIKARKLVDGSKHAEQELINGELKINKGKIADVSAGNSCLLKMAFDLRETEVTIKLPENSDEGETEIANGEGEGEAGDDDERDGSSVDNWEHVEAELLEGVLTGTSDDLELVLEDENDDQEDD